MMRKIHLPVLITRALASSDSQYEQQKFEGIPEIFECFLPEHWQHNEEQ